jgi:hypothetical protein
MSEKYAKHQVQNVSYITQERLKKYGIKVWSELIQNKAGSSGCYGHNNEILQHL